MLAIGRALMGRPKRLLPVESSKGLVPQLVGEVFNVVKTLKVQGMSITLAEKNALVALAIADRGCAMETGIITVTVTGQRLSATSKREPLIWACATESRRTKLVEKLQA